MPSPADIPARRRAPAEPEPVEQPAPRKRRNCSNPHCHTRIYYPRYACRSCWMQLPVELQERLKTGRKAARKREVPRDDPFRVAAREAKRLWGRIAAGDTR